jgi:hypothetical protein
MAKPMKTMFYKSYLGHGLGYRRVPVYAVRKCQAENYSPMMRNLLPGMIKNGMIQVKIDYLGTRMWININRKELEIKYT